MRVPNVPGPGRNVFLELNTQCSTSQGCFGLVKFLLLPGLHQTPKTSLCSESAVCFAGFV